MKKIIAFNLFMCIVYIVSAQNLDLIVTANGDSIACEILNVTDSEIIFKVEASGHKNVQTHLNREKVTEFKYDVIQEDLYRYKPGTSYIIGKVHTISPETYYPISSETYLLENLQKASSEELAFYFYKANRLRKTGGKLTLFGLAGFVGGIAIVWLAWDKLSGEVLATDLIIAVAGIPTTLVGLSILNTGSSRVKKINNLERNSHSGFNMNLKPDIQYNQFTQNYQPGLTLSICF